MATSQVQRRGLLAGAGLLAAGAAVAAPTSTQPALTPIVAAGMRLAALSALGERDLSDDEFDAVTHEQCSLQAQITDAQPLSVADAVVLLMVATCDVGGPALHEDGAFYHERSNILVLRFSRRG